MHPLFAVQTLNTIEFELDFVRQASMFYHQNSTLHYINSMSQQINGYVWKFT